MARCAHCDRELPGMETLCRACYRREYRRLNAPEKSFLQWLGGYGWIALLVAGVWAILHAELFVISSSPGLLHGAQLLRQGFVWVASWIFAPWILITEWRAQRTLRTLFFGLIFIVQLVCAVLGWVSGAKLWFQIDMDLAVLMVIYGYTVR